MKKQGFSLTELLVVIAVIGIIASLIVPLVLSVRAQGRVTVCAANLKQINSALSLYISDNDGVYPPAVSSAFIGNDTQIASLDWLDLIGSYLNRSYPRCPDVELTGRLAKASTKHETCGYGYNERLNNIQVLTILSKVGSQKDVLFGHSETTLASPSFSVTIFDIRAAMTARSKPDLGISENQIGGIYSMDFEHEILDQTPGALRHHGGANYSFADGHVKWLKPEQIRTDKQGNGIHPGFGL